MASNNFARVASKAVLIFWSGEVKTKQRNTNILASLWNSWPRSSPSRRPPPGLRSNTQTTRCISRWRTGHHPPASMRLLGSSLLQKYSVAQPEHLLLIVPPPTCHFHWWTVCVGTDGKWVDLGLLLVYCLFIAKSQFCASPVWGAEQLLSNKKGGTQSKEFL